MAIDQEIIKAIRQAVSANGQPASVGDKLIAWFEAVVSENEDSHDMSKAGARLDLIFNDLKIDDGRI